MLRTCMSILDIHHGPLAEESLQRLHTFTCVLFVHTCGVIPPPPKFNVESVVCGRALAVGTVVKTPPTRTESIIATLPISRPITPAPTLNFRGAGNLCLPACGLALRACVCIHRCNGYSVHRQKQRLAIDFLTPLVIRPIPISPMLIQSQSKRILLNGFPFTSLHHR